MYDCSVQHASFARKFTGKERDSESGLDNFGARYDSSNTGRFMSADPKMLSIRHINNSQKWNKYAYTINNPLSYFDPNGMDEIQIQLKAYIPQHDVALYKGDNRGPTTSQAVTSRTEVSFRIQTNQSKLPPGSTPMLGSSPPKAGQSENIFTGNKDKQVDGLPTVTSAKFDAKGNAVITIQQNSTNPLVDTPLTGTIRTDITITIPASGSSVTTAGTLSGSPAFELNVFGSGGQATNIPLQTAPTNSAGFVVGLYQTNNIFDFTPLPPPPPPPPPCVPGPNKLCAE